MPSADDPADELELDLETAYRRAMEAVDASGIGPVEAGDEDAPCESERAAAPPSAPRPSRVGPTRVLEAALFVGGDEADAGDRPALSRKTLARLLGGEYDEPAIERMLAELAGRYDREGRPFRLVSGEGGYRLELREEFDEVRRRVFGVVPRDVKLSAAAVEVLALVAYEQPLTRNEADARFDRAVGATLSTLVRRGLVRVDGEKRYVTTPRFLEAVGVGSLDELPRVGRLGMK